MALSFLEAVKKFNPYHDRLGRFTTAGSATLFTYRTRSKLSQGAADKAAEREKKLTSAAMPTEAQAKTLKSIESRTRNLKKEQFRVVDREGNVVMQKQGDATSVTYKIGEAREHFPGNITIHNHPDGGTFSTPDLSDIGHGATEIRVASPEGTYILRNTRYGRKYNSAKEKTWFDMREDLEAASADFKQDAAIRKETKARYKAEYDEKVLPWANKWAEAKDRGASKEELQKFIDGYDKAQKAWDAETKPKIEKEIRATYVEQYHQWYKKNAHNYGLEYEFIPAKTRMKKGFDEIVMKSADVGDVVLDKQMNDDILELTEKVMAEIMESGRIESFSGKARSFSESIEKFNPYHDRLGRFTTAGNATLFTIRTKAGYNQGMADKAVEREKKRGKTNFVSSVTGSQFDMPELENEAAYEYREKTLRHVEQYFSREAFKPVKEKYDATMKRYLEETDTAEWESRSRKDVFSIKHNFITAKTPTERKQEAERRKDRDSHDRAIERAALKGTQKFQEYRNYENSLREKYTKDSWNKRDWHSKTTQQERDKLQELREATVFRNKRGQWQIAKSLEEMDIEIVDEA
jgi:hypothetical protein